MNSRPAPNGAYADLRCHSRLGQFAHTKHGETSACSPCPGRRLLPNAMVTNNVVDLRAEALFARRAKCCLCSGFRSSTRARQHD
jgi:hypothetical protein